VRSCERLRGKGDLERNWPAGRGSSSSYAAFGEISTPPASSRWVFPQWAWWEVRLPARRWMTVRGARINPDCGDGDGIWQEKSPAASAHSPSSVIQSGARWLQNPASLNCCQVDSHGLDASP
jgi:hypothetical protein